MTSLFSRPGTPPSGQSNYYSKQNSSEMPNGPSDSVSQLAWSPDGQALACASWDRTCRIWQVTAQQAAFGANTTHIGTPQALYTETAPILSCCFGETTQMLFTAGCDKQVKVYDVLSGRTTGQVIGQHDSPVCFVGWNPMFKVAMSASWDGSVKMWDGKQPNPIWQQNVGAKQPLNFGTVAASANAAASLPLVTKVCSNYQKMQTRSISFFPDDASQNPGVVLGSVEGRCSVMYLKEEHRSMDFSFRCHRSEENPNCMRIFSVNAISFNKLKTLCTGGSDGIISCWDKESRQKVKVFESAGAPIADLKFSPTSTALAYAVSYDWHKGPDQQELAKGHHVYIHEMKEEDIRPRPKTATRR